MMNARALKRARLTQKAMAKAVAAAAAAAAAAEVAQTAAAEAPANEDEDVRGEGGEAADTACVVQVEAEQLVEQLHGAGSTSAASAESSSAGDFDASAEQTEAALNLALAKERILGQWC